MIDCFMFFNELDLLEIRLNSLAPYIEKFVLCENTLTFSGKSKPLFFQENKDRFKDFNIIHLIADGGMTENAGKNKGDAWRRENYQREFLMNEIHNESEDTMILVSDLDEIPNLSEYDGVSEGVFRQKLYRHYLNAFSGDHRWKGSIAVKLKNIPTLNILRDKRNKLNVILRNGGWHFSSLGTIENIIYKIESFAHTEYNTEKIKSQVQNRREDLIDPFGRSDCRYIIQDPDGPDWLLKNKDRYPHLWYHEDN